jgi:hypothetical protein
MMVMFELGLFTFSFLMGFYSAVRLRNWDYVLGALFLCWGTAYGILAHLGLGQPDRVAETFIP